MAEAKNYLLEDIKTNNVGTSYYYGQSSFIVLYDLTENSECPVDLLTMRLEGWDTRRAICLVMSNRFLDEWSLLLKDNLLGLKYLAL